MRFVGLDVHKKVIEACFLSPEGKVEERLRFDLTRESLREFAEKRLGSEDRVALEATTNTWAVVEALKPHAGEVAVSNPLKTRAIAEARIKTDKVDAEVLAQLLRADFLPRVWEPAEDIRELRRLCSRRAALVGHSVAIKNRIHSILHQRMIQAPEEDLFSEKGLAWLKSLDLDEEGRFTLDSDLRLLNAIQAEQQALKMHLVPKAYSDERVKLLMTLPGVDYTIALALVSALGDISRFKEADKAASYLGLVPSTKQSAFHTYHGPITKQGNSHGRWLMVQAAQHVALHPGPLGHFFRKLAARKNRNVAVVATARKLVVIAWHMLKSNQPYRYALPGPTELKLQRLRVLATGEKRKTGPKPGSDPHAPKLGPGTRSRTFKSLPQLLADEGLPSLQAPPPGEAKTLTAAKSRRFAKSLNKPTVLPKPRKTKP
jgi:transposase